MSWWHSFQKYFVPHDSNEHQPYFLREWSVVSLLMLIILVEGAAVAVSFFVLPRTATLYQALPEAALTTLNQSRARAGRAPLVADQALTLVAAERAQALAMAGNIALMVPLSTNEYRAVNFFDAEDLVEVWQSLPSVDDPLNSARSGRVGIGVAAGRHQDRASLYAVALVADQAGQISNLPAPLLNQAFDAAVGVARLGFWTKLATALHGLASKVYLVLLVLIAIAVLLNLVVAIRIQHLPTIVNGLLVILLLSGLLYINNYLFVERIQAIYLPFVV